MNKLQKIGITSLILSYVIIIISLIGDNKGQEILYLFYTAWILGIISVVSNIILADKIKLNHWLIGAFGICGLIWFFPPFLITSFGIPFIVIFLCIGIYIHLKSYKFK